MKKKERNYIILCLLLLLILCAFGIGSFIYTVTYHLDHTNDDAYSFLELLYLGVHIVYTILGIYFSLKALKSESMVMRTLMFDKTKGGRRSKTAGIVALVLSSIGLAMIIYEILCLCGIAYDFSFGMALKMDILNAGLLLFIFGIVFFFFPFVAPYKNEKKEILYTDENIL